MSRVAAIVISSVVAVTGCGDQTKCGNGVEAADFTLRSADMTVTVTTRPYSLKVVDAAGNVVVDGGTVGWTTGNFVISRALYNGYLNKNAELDPWRTEMNVVASEERDGALLLTLHPTSGDDDTCITVAHTLRSGTLRVEAHRGGSGDAPRAWQVAFASPSDEAFLGLGERFDQMDHRGQSVYSWPEEGGITEGEAVPPSPTNPYPNGGTMTYYPVPFFLSTRGYGFWLDTYEYNQFELANESPDAWRAWEVGQTLAFEIYVPVAGDTRPWPLQVLDTFTATTGRPMIPPAWSFGPRRRIGRENAVNGVPEIQAMRDEDLAITAADDAVHFLPNGSDIAIHDELVAWVDAATALGYKLIGYYNPYFASTPDSPLASVTAEGVANGYFLLDEDGTPGVVTLISGEPLAVYTVDVTNPDANSWFTQQFKRALDLGYDGWMYDFGEYVQPTWTASDGRSGVSLHNEFPVLYDKAAHDALEQLKPGDWYYFSRSGYTGSQAYAPMTWSGDPDASFGQAEGLPAQLRATIALSLSGVAHVGSDIGGFKCQHNTAETANGELIARWIEVGSMSSDMHDENNCGGGPAKATIWDSADAQTAWRTYARLHTRLGPYMSACAAAAHVTGAPLMMSPWLLHPERRDLAPVDTAFYFGPGLYVVPVVTRGATTVTTKLPPGEFIDWRDGTLHDGGTDVTLPAPITEMPILLVDGQLVPLLDPTIDTLAEETSPDVVGPTDVADVYDVTGVISQARGTATFTLADGATLTAQYDGADVMCTGCSVTPLGARVHRVRVETSGNLDAGGLKLSSSGITRRLRWDLYLVD